MFERFFRRPERTQAQPIQPERPPVSHPRLIWDTTLSTTPLSPTEVLYANEMSAHFDTQAKHLARCGCPVCLRELPTVVSESVFHFSAEVRPRAYSHRIRSYIEEAGKNRLSKK